MTFGGSIAITRALMNELGVEVEPSPIAGLGVFACRAIDAGERIRRVNVVREITADAALREDLRLTCGAGRCLRCRDQTAWLSNRFSSKAVWKKAVE